MKKEQIQVKVLINFYSRSFSLSCALIRLPRESIVAVIAAILNSNRIHNNESVDQSELVQSLMTRKRISHRPLGSRSLTVIHHLDVRATRKSRDSIQCIDWGEIIKHFANAKININFSHRSSRPTKRSTLFAQDPNESDSGDEDDDDDGFELLTAENLFSTLLSRVRALTHRLNVNNETTSNFPSTRFMSNLRQTSQGPFWNNDPFAR